MSLFEKLKEVIKKEDYEQTEELFKIVIREANIAVIKRISWIEERQEQLKSIERMLRDFEKNINAGEILDQDDLDAFFEGHKEAEAILNGKNSSTAKLRSYTGG